MNLKAIPADGGQCTSQGDGSQGREGVSVGASCWWNLGGMAGIRGVRFVKREVLSMKFLASVTR